MELHKKQGQAFLSDKKITLCAAGLQSGKTTVGALWFMRQASKWKGRHNFIIGAPTFRILQQSTLPSFLKIANSFGEYKKGDAEFHLKSGGTIFFRSSTDPDSVEGIPDVRAAWIDEAGKCKYAFFANIEGRCARTNAPIILTTTAYARNWPFSEIIKPFEQGLRDDVLYLNWPSYENPAFSREYYDRQKQLLDPIRFAMRFDGLHAKRYGLVFDLPEGAIVPFQAIPDGTKFYAGIDWGFSDPLAIVIRGKTPDGFDIQVKEFYETGIFPDQIKDIVKNLHMQWKCELWLADGSQPGMIQMLQKAGVPMVSGDRKKGDLKAGIDAHNILIRSGKYKIYDTCKHTIDEYETYHWPDTEEEGLDAEDSPVDENNHAMDANRYVSMFHAKQGTLDQHAGPRVHQGGGSGAPKLEYTHVPAWKRKKNGVKSYDEL